MKNETFIQNLPPTIGKDTILKELRIVRAELNESTIPSYTTAKDAFTGEFKDLVADRLDIQFTRFSGKRGNLVAVIEEGLLNVQESLDKIEALIQKTFNKELATGAITFKEANVLQYIDVAWFLSRYARYLLMYLYAAESAQFETSGIKLNESFSKAEVKWLEQHMSDFGTAFKTLTAKPADVISDLNKIPDASANVDTIRALSVTLGEKKIDPFEVRHLTDDATKTFRYRIMAYFADRDIQKYKQSQEEKRLLELRHLYLLRQRETGKPDTLLEKEIVQIEDRIKRLADKIKRMEDANA